MTKLFCDRCGMESERLWPLVHVFGNYGLARGKRICAGCEDGLRRLITGWFPKAFETPL